MTCTSVSLDVLKSNFLKWYQAYFIFLVMLMFWIFVGDVLNRSNRFVTHDFPNQVYHLYDLLFMWYISAIATTWCAIYMVYFRYTNYLMSYICGIFQVYQLLDVLHMWYISGIPTTWCAAYVVYFRYTNYLMSCICCIFQVYQLLDELYICGIFQVYQLLDELYMWYI